MKRDLHVLPVNDIRTHVETRDCWCGPALRDEDGAVIVVHVSADGRELVEQHGVN